MKPYVFFLVFFGVFYLIGIISVVSTLVIKLPPLKRVTITLRINAVIFISGCLMLAVAILFEVNYLSYESPIPYVDWKKITFADFRGLKRPDQTLDGQNDFAFIVSQIIVEQKNKAITVTTVFHPARSYVFNTKLEDGHLLTHELYHMHITEYCARLMRREIINAPKPVSANTLERMRPWFRRFEDSLQFQYDDQTYHSYVVGKQKYWQYQVDSCLNSVKEFENPVINNQ